MKNIFFYQTNIGKIGIVENGTAITNLYFENEEIPKDAVILETELIRNAAEQLNCYLCGKKKQFEIPLAPEGTDFMHIVWKALCDIPYGETRSYMDIAKAIGKPKAYRAVGLANSKNPISIFIPCHRVIGTNGKLTGYLGGLQVKQYLLELEKQHGSI